MEGPGRPSTYNEKLHPKLVLALAQQGLTNDQIAERLEINRDTLYEWYRLYPELSDAKKEGAKNPDDMVEAALYQRATGYRWQEQQAIRVKVAQHQEKVEIVNLERSVPPDTGAAAFWLKNRRPDKWRERREEPIPIETNPLQVEFKDDPTILDPEKQDNLEISSGRDDSDPE